MILRIGLAILCIALVGCGAFGQPAGGAPAAAGTPASKYAMPQATGQQAPPTAADNNTQPDPGRVATSVAATIAAANPTLASAAATLPAAIPTLAGGAVGEIPLTGPVALLPLEQLLDFGVADASGMLIGKVEDMIIDLSQAGITNTAGSTAGSIPYLLVSNSANDDWLIPIPWQSVQIHTGMRAILLPASANLMTAPRFHEDAWPGGLPAEWRSALLNYWQNPGQNNAAALPALPALGISAPADYLSASDLMDYDVVDQRFFELGEIKEIAIDWAKSQPGPNSAAAQFAYVIIDRDDALGPGNEYIPIPWNRLQLNRQQEIAVLNMSPQALRSAPSFNKISWPDLYGDPWSADLARFWKP